MAGAIQLCAIELSHHAAESLFNVLQNTLRQHWDELQQQKAAPLDSLQQPASEVVDTPVAALAAVRRMAREVHPTRMHVLVRPLPWSEIHPSRC